MTDTIDNTFFRDLAGKKPEDVCRRAGCHYDDEKKCYSLSVLGRKYVVFPHDFRVECIDAPDQAVGEYLSLFIIHYLLTSRSVEFDGEWISEKDIPGGEGFFRGPHLFPTHVITEKYGNDVYMFKTVCKKMGGLPIEMADAAFSFEVAPRIRIALLFWEGDEDFPPEVKMLFDKTVGEHLALDIIYAVACFLCYQIGR